ncbi:MAG: hypothetical protein KAJ07_04610 [Planctomycetes bacterium]|nr:hypothetical protein [Planctomycetota bacterium]
MAKQISNTPPKTKVELPAAWLDRPDMAANCAALVKYCQDHGVEIKLKFGFLAVRGPGRSFSYVYLQTNLEPVVSMAGFIQSLEKRIPDLKGV